MASLTVAVPSRFPQDTTIFHEALKNWQERNRETRKWEQLSQVERSAIMGDAQALKANARDLSCSCEPLTIDEVLDGSLRRSR
jgi:response regulator of citrate/malate metabolism